MRRIFHAVTRFMKREEGAIALEYGMAAIAISACTAAGLTLSGSLSNILF
ncbi:MAG: Flp family type IVb pilin [Planctomycetaceae bacterium]|jgi:Flp pilus assembly pilin Flp